jgi:hypothetical protein
MLTLNHILLLLILLAFPHGLPDHRFMLQFVLTVPPQDHEPSISSTISLPICEPLSISPTSYRNSPMGPPPFIHFLRHFCPAWGTHFYTGAPVSVFCTSFPNLFIDYCTNPFIPSHLQLVTHVVTVGDLPSFFLATRNLCYPWLEHHFSFTLASIVYIFRVLLRSLTIYPLNLFTLSRLWHNLSLVLSSP